MSSAASSDMSGGDRYAAPGGIQIRNLSVRYGGPNGLLAVDRVSCDIADGEFVSIVGPSGCGKSSLLSVVAGLERPSEGELTWSGRSTPQVGMVFQEDCLLDWRTIIDNVLLPLELRGEKRSDHAGRARAMLEEVGLGNFVSVYPHQMSGGMRQRAAICRALICDHPTLLMDEPFGALDAMSRETQQQLLQSIWSQHRKTVVFVTHDIPEAVLLSDRVMVMSSRPGRLVGTIAIDLPRPRGIAMTTEAHFNALVAEVRQMLHGGM